MFLYAKFTLLKFDGTTKISMWIIHIRNADTFTDEIAAQLLNQLAHTEVVKTKAVSATAEWISFMEAEQIIKNSREKQ